MDWHRYFGDALISGDPDEISAAVEAAAAAERGGADHAAATAAGKAAAARHRGAGRAAGAAWGGAATHGASGGTASRATPGGWGQASGTATRTRQSYTAAPWSQQLATRLFTPPVRWGWEAAPVPAAVVVPDPPPAPAPWIEPPRPDASALHAARSRAVSTMVRRLAFAAVIAVAFTTYQLAIQTNINRYGGASASRIFRVVVIVVAALLALGVIRALNGVRRASGAIRAFEQPYLALRAAERERHEQAAREWTEVVRRHRQQTAEAARVAAEQASGPRWYPVAPRSEPTRIDVLGGDPNRHGWASLLTTVGTSALATGHRVTVLDLTGSDVGGGLLAVAGAHGLPTSRLDIGDGRPVNLLYGVPGHGVAECLAYALTDRDDAGDQRQERALLTEVLTWVRDGQPGPVSLGRLAAGVRVLRQGMPDGVLTDDEISRLAAHIVDLDQNEWTARQLRFLVNQLDALHAAAPPGDSSLWTAAAVRVVTTPGGAGDRKELLDRLLVEVARAAMADRSRFGGVLVVCGADRVGANILTRLSDQALRAEVRLMQMIDQPRGELERAAGTGGAVCVMKMYNHRDAAVAAEFIGKGHRFVLNQVTQQVGKSFSESGGDSFSANTGHSDGVNMGLRDKRNVSDSRGHTWTGTRNWTGTDNIGSSTGFGRVYDFIVDPQQILGMPETAFILVDNSAEGRRVLLADSNPGISLADRIGTPRD